jgi:hypothetical protein
MKELRFHSELFSQRSIAIDALGTEGFEWFADYSTVDIDHELCGLEIGGIRDKATAKQIRRVLRAAFPAWRHSRVYEKDWGDRDLGWWVMIHRDPERLY